MKKCTLDNQFKIFALYKSSGQFYASLVYNITKTNVYTALTIIHAPTLVRRSHDSDISNPK